MMKRARFIGGIVLALGAALIFVTGAADSVAVPIGLGVVGIALIAVSRRQVD
jgi:hypothetical protein